MSELRRYLNIGSDSARWELFEHRPGDIIISTPPKTGTTLVQRLCSLAIFESADLEQPMDVISPWFDQHSRSDEDALWLVDAIEHRRFIKTHTPLDGIPCWDDVIYLATARDPRDLFASWEGQIGNLDPARTREAFATGVGLEKLADLLAPPPGSLEERLEAWLGNEDLNAFSLARHVHQMQVSWDRQEAPNVSVFHFDELKADRRAALDAVATAIDIELSPSAIDELAPFTTLDAMRSDAANLAPNTKGIFAEPDKFFRTGERGGWQDYLTNELLERYWERCHQFGSQELLDWVHADRCLSSTVTEPL